MESRISFKTPLAAIIVATIGISDFAFAKSQLEEVIVTARKRDERLQDVPVSITALSSSDIDRYATNSINSIATRVPELMIGGASGPGGSSISLRGVGSSAVNPTVDQAVSLNIDGIQLSQSNAVVMGLYDLERVEVLKGPQALFYGKNSLGGIISLVSANPGDELEWHVRAGYEFESERYQVEGMVSSPITDNLGIRLVGSYSDQEGYFKNVGNSIPGGTVVSTHNGNDQEEHFIRVTLDYEDPDGIFNANFKVAHAKQERDNGIASTFQIFDCVGAQPLMYFGATGGVNGCKLDRQYTETDISSGVAALAPRYMKDGRPYFENDQLLASLSLNWNLANNLTLSSVTGYYDYEEAWGTNYFQTEFDSVTTGSIVEDTQITQELRLASDYDSMFNFMLGGFYQDADKSFDAPQLFNDPVTSAFFGGFGLSGPLLVADDRFSQDTEAWSIFAQTIFKLSAQWELTLGGRYSEETKDIAGQRYPSFSSFYAPPTDFVFIKDSETFENFSPEATLSYSPTDNMTVYAAYREGFTSGGFDAVPGVYSTFTPNDGKFEQATAEGGEVGVKGSIAEGRLRYDFTAYVYDYDDLQLSILNPQTLGLSVQNAASARSKGLEASFDYLAESIEGLRLYGNVTYNRGRYRDYRDAACYAGQSSEQGCNQDLFVDPIFGDRFKHQDLSGEPLERAPEWSMNYGFNYEAPISDAVTLSIGGDASYTDTFMPHPEHDPRAWQDDVWRFNAVIGLIGQDNGWEISLIGKNLTNELTASTAFSAGLNSGPSGLPFATTGADLAGGVSEPRSVLLQFTLRDTFFN